MPTFNQRWNQAIDKFCNAHRYRARGGRTAAMTDLRRAFGNSTFIYGTVGPNALHNGGTGNKLAKAVHLIIRRARANQGPVALAGNFVLYDPGARAIALCRGGYQMMDMYYGMNNQLFHKRNPIIAEFVHYAMRFDQLGNRPAFDPNVSGRDAYFQAFPAVAGQAAVEGYKANGRMDQEYGHSVTKEMSKIIRRGISEFGGTLILEGQNVFGAGVFDPNAYQGDTDLEAQDLLSYFVRPRSTATRFGNGALIFHWGGVPTVPTRAHFLTNWNFGGQQHKTSAYRHWNRINQDNAAQPFRDYVTKLMSPNHGLRPLWNNFDNFPVAFAGPQTTRGMEGLIADLVQLIRRRGC